MEMGADSRPSEHHSTISGDAVITVQQCILPMIGHQQAFLSDILII